MGLSNSDRSSDEKSDDSLFSSSSVELLRELSDGRGREGARLVAAGKPDQRAASEGTMTGIGLLALATRAGVSWGKCVGAVL
jgi:hypothetical protein